MASIDKLLAAMLTHHADALVLKEGEAAMLMIVGQAKPVSKQVLSAQQVSGLVREIASPAAQQALYNARPVWAVAAYAFAVWGGLLGSIALLLKKRWATPVFAVSLAGVIVQDTALFLFTNATTKVGAPVYLLQALVIIVCVLLVWLSRKAAAAGWTG